MGKQGRQWDVDTTKAGFKPKFPIRAPQFDRPKKTQAGRI